jgi:hypothetical protein
MTQLDASQIAHPDPDVRRGVIDRPRRHGQGSQQNAGLHRNEDGAESHGQDCRKKAIPPMPENL